MIREDMKKTFDVVIEKGESGYLIASVPSLPGCHTQGKSIEEVLERIKEAIELYLEVDRDAAKEASPELVGVKRVEVLV